MLLITEQIEEVKPLIQESSEGKKHMYLEGIFMQGVPNKNGRIYPMETLIKETNRYSNDKVVARTAYGELGHPDGPKINEDRISHLIESLKVDGKNIVGRAKLMDTPKGNIAKGIIESGGALGMSSRGLGSLKKLQNGLLEVQEDFKIVTAADIVVEPSAPDAFVNGIMENVEWFYNESNGEWVRRNVEMVKESVSKMSKRKLEESKLRVFKHFLDNISKQQ